jgi:uncharacterized protein
VLMKSFLAELFQNSPTSLLLLFLWGSLAIILAIQKKLFSLPPEIDRKRIPSSFFSLWAPFVLFALLNFFLGPVFLYLIQQLTHFFVLPGGLERVFSSILQVFASFLILMWFSFSCLKETLFFFFAPPNENRPSMWNNISISFLFWWLLFPIVTFLHQLLSSFILYFVQLPQLPDQVALEFLKMSLSSPLAFFFALIILIVLAPITEELLFRGFLHNWLKKELGRTAALVLSSLCFALFHFSFSQGLNNIPILFSLFSLGLGLGFIYERQASLSAPILLHSFFNLISALNFAYLQGST